MWNLWVGRVLEFSVLDREGCFGKLVGCFFFIVVFVGNLGGWFL